MKKTIILISLIVAGFVGNVFAQSYTFTISGTVTGITTGQPIANHNVTIIDSLGGTPIVTVTNASGFYSFTTVVQPFYQPMFIVSTMGLCGPNNVYTNNVFANPNGIGIADFVVCDSGIVTACNAMFLYDIGIVPQSMFFDFSTSTFPILSWYWNFGDGTTSYDQNPIHHYNSTGTYTVCLTILTADSCSSTYCDSIYYLNNGTGNNCQADFNYSQAISMNSIVAFTDYSTSNLGTVLSWSWDFGDGNTSLLQNPGHTYASAGMYQVCLDIMTSDGCSGSYCDYVLVNMSPTPDCQAGFYYSNSSPAPGNTSLDFYDDSYIATGTVTNWLWNFGDGNTSTSQDPTHIYSSAGAYIVCLDIFTSDSCTSSYCDYIIVGDSIPNPDCQADFAYGISAISPDMFTDLSISSGNIVSWNWDFGDGTFSTDQNPIHQYASSGYYFVCLDIATDSGCTSSYCDYISNYASAGCSADFYSYTNNPSGYGLDYVFQDMSNGNIIDWAWDFGDGTSSTDQNPTHTFLTAGVYNVCLSIFTSDSCSSTECYNVYAFDSVATNCSAYFTYGGTSGVIQQGVFTDGSTSTGTILGWHWDFGDGDSSFDQNPVHQYASAGTYQVCLDIYTDNNCTDTYCETITYASAGSSWCDADFSYAYDTTINCVYGYQFTNFSSASGNVIAWTWDFGDGNTSNDQNPTHCFSAVGIYHVCLDILTDSGCVSSYCDYVQVQNQATVYNVSGTVYAGNSTATDAMVMLMGVSGSIYSINLNPNGTYNFSGIPEDTYIAYALPFMANTNYVPTYHDSTLFWADATEIVLLSDTTTIDIYLKEYFATATGPGTIAGNIIWLGGGTKSTSTNTYKDRAIASVENISVLIFDSNENFINYSVSDANGGFEFNNLEYGTYKVMLELPGHITYPAIITIDANNTIIDNVIFDIDNGTVYYDVNEISLINNNVKIFPNPVQHNLNIEFELNKASDVKITALNSLGQEVFSTNNELNAGHQKLNFDVSKLTKGIYFISIERADFNKQVFKFIK